MDGKDDISIAEAMSAKYVFPYHHLPQGAGGRTLAGRDFRYSLAYLGYLNEIIKEVEGLGAKSVLEIGCGDGRLASELNLRTECTYLGVDIDDRAIGFARAFTCSERAEFLCGDIRDIRQDEFDVAIMSEVLEHIPGSDVPSILGAIHERLRPGGNLLITVPSASIPVTPAHHRHYTSLTLIDSLEPLFVVDNLRFLNRHGLFLKICERLLVNRIFSLKEPLTTKLITKAYNKYLLNTDERYSEQLFAVLTKREVG